MDTQSMEFSSQILGVVACSLLRGHPFVQDLLFSEDNTTSGAQTEVSQGRWLTTVRAEEAE